MSKIQQLRDAMLVARKARNSEESTLLGYLIGESTKKEKEPSDKDVIDIIKKFVKNMNETPITSPAEFIEQCKREAAIASRFLPVQLSVDQIITEINSVIAANPDAATKFNLVMAHMNTNFAGLFEGGVVRENWLAITGAKK